MVQFRMLLLSSILALGFTNVLARIVHRTPLNGRFKVACMAENIKKSGRYICDKNGEIRCLSGYQNETNLCKDPVCNPPCVSGQGKCTDPDCCTCEIGWTGDDCSKCLCMPGCQNGDCKLPFQCNCKPGWTGMFCDTPLCKAGCVHGECSMSGQCNCFPGWSGPNCSVCDKLPGCSEHGFCTRPLECRCEEGYIGNFCQTPKCRQGCNMTTGFCDKPNECWCNKGWTGENCQTCVAYPACKHGFCIQPWECLCHEGYTGMNCDKVLSLEPSSGEDRELTVTKATTRSSTKSKSSKEELLGRGKVQTKAPQTDSIKVGLVSDAEVIAQQQPQQPVTKPKAIKGQGEIKFGVPDATNFIALNISNINLPAQLKKPTQG